MISFASCFTIVRPSPILARNVLGSKAAYPLFVVMTLKLLAVQHLVRTRDRKSRIRNMHRPFGGRYNFLPLHPPVATNRRALPLPAGLIPKTVLPFSEFGARCGDVDGQDSLRPTLPRDCADEGNGAIALRFRRARGLRARVPIDRPSAPGRRASGLPFCA